MLHSGETLIRKWILECEAADIGFKLKHFLANNVIYTSTEFRADLTSKKQTIKFFGVGAYHQNVIVERSIKYIYYLACSHLIHSTLRWPSHHDLQL